MSTPELTTVVRINTGEIVEVALKHNPYRDYVWYPAHLNKDGGFPRNRHPDGAMVSRQPQLRDFALYHPEREARAQPIRVRLGSLRDQITEAERELLTLYTPEATQIGG